MATLKVNIDQVNNPDLKDVSTTAFRVVDAIQNAHSPASQVLSVAIVMRTVADRLGVDPRYLLEVAGRIIAKDGESTNQLRAVKHYVNEEL